MGIVEDVIWAITHPFEPVIRTPDEAMTLDPVTNTPAGVSPLPTYSTTPDPMTDESVRAKRIYTALAALGAIIAAPLGYSVYLGSKRKKKGLTERERATGIALENTSTQIADLTKVALASPYIALPLAYIGVQMLEQYPTGYTKNGVYHPPGYISSDLGNAVQSLMALTAAGPAIQGVTGIARSAFTKGKA